MEIIYLHSVSPYKISLLPSSIPFLRDFALYNIAVENVRESNLMNLAEDLREGTFKDLFILNLRKTFINMRIM